MSLIYSRTQDGTIYVIVAGKVVRDAEVKQTGTVSRVKFTVAYDKKLYMDCEARADFDVGAVAACLEKNDTVAVMGKHRTWDYDGKSYQSVSADMIFTMAAPQAYAPAPSEPAAETSAFSEIDDSEGELPF